MTRALFVDFADAAGIRSGVEAARAEKLEILDAFTPFPIEGLGAEIGGKGGGRSVRIWMLVGGLAAAAAAYGLQVYSAVYAYPFNVGSRPPNSWPTFMLFPFEFGILAAAIFGLIGLFRATGLPRLHHAAFDIEGFDRASNDRFILALTPPEGKRQRARVEERFAKLGAIAVREVEL